LGYKTSSQWCLNIVSGTVTIIIWEVILIILATKRVLDAVNTVRNIVNCVIDGGIPVNLAPCIFPRLSTKLRRFLVELLDMLTHWLVSYSYVKWNGVLLTFSNFNLVSDKYLCAVYLNALFDHRDYNMSSL